MATCYARKSADGNLQTLDEHLNNTADYAGIFSIYKNISKISGLIHDLGKATKAFQTYLMDGGIRGSVLHSAQGAFYIYDALQRSDMRQDEANIKLLCNALELVVFAHHSKLADCVNTNAGDEIAERNNRVAEPLFGYEEVSGYIKSNAVIGGRLKNLFSGATEELIGVTKKIIRISRVKQSAYFALGLFLKYLYSCLVDADRLDAYAFEAAASPSAFMKQAEWEGLIKIFEAGIAKFPCESEIARARQAISEECKNSAGNDTGIYLLTVPTGGGKTLSSLRFALHHAKKHNKQRIIYVIPYLSIIEQTAQNIKKILNLDGNSEIILEDHSSVNKLEDDESEVWERRKLACARWDSPIVITTMVNFLESVMSAKAGELRKFHNMQDSVIIFDEIQSLPVHSIKLFKEVVNFLSAILDSTIVLCTATQPSIKDAGRNELLLSKNPSLISVETLSKNAGYFKRVRLEYAGRLSTGGFSQFVADKASNNRNMLVIVNTKAVACTVYNHVKEQLKNYKVYHLSTSMCPAHRLRTLESVKSLLGRREKVILISTQLIEAGVDISFDCVVRATAGLDSVVQAAGRCNRNGESVIPRTVYVAGISDENVDSLVDIKLGKEITERLFREHKSEDVDYFDEKILAEYYNTFYGKTENRMGYPTKNGDVYEMLSSNTAGVGAYQNKNGKQFPSMFCQAFASADENYSVISKDTENVVVCYGEAESLIEKLRKTYPAGEKIKILKELQKHSVSLHKGMAYNELFANGMLVTADEEFDVKLLNAIYYSDETGAAIKIKDLTLIV